MANQNDSSERKTTLLYWLAQACVESRENAGASQEEVSALVKRLGIRSGSGVDAVRRFEEGETWPRNAEAFLVVYATLGGYEKPQELVVRGAQLWMEAGDMPDFPVEQTCPMMRAIAQMGNYLAVGLVALISVPMGLAATGVSLPSSAHKPFNAVGIELPNQAKPAAPPTPALAAPVTGTDSSAWRGIGGFHVTEKPAPPGPGVTTERVIHPSPVPVKPPAKIFPRPQQPIPTIWVPPIVEEVIKAVEPILIPEEKPEQKSKRGKKKGLLGLVPIELPPIELPPILEEPVGEEPELEEPVEEATPTDQQLLDTRPHSAESSSPHTEQPDGDTTQVSQPPRQEESLRGSESSRPSPQDSRKQPA